MEKQNNGDLISRSELLRIFSDKEPIVQGPHDGMGLCAHGMWRHLRETVKKAPAVEAEPVVHAHWIMRGGRFRCSRCDAKALWRDLGGTHGYSHEWEQVKTQYCPNSRCGAHMDEEVADGDNPV